jgi:hypothetical protein
LPFDVREIHSDNGSEFLNAHLVQFWGEAADHIKLSRSRPYQKDDNPFVEQKNSSLIRAYLGHGWLDTVAQTRSLKELYEKMGCYYNLFQPVTRVEEKIIIPANNGQPSRVKRRYDQPRTPFERLCETDAISDLQRDQLTALRQSINPRTLRQEILALCDELFRLPNAVPGLTENVHQSLHYPWDLELPIEDSDQPSTLVQSCPSTYNDG